VVAVRFILITVVAWSFAGAQEVGLTATADKKDIRLGEPVRITVSARTSVEIDTIGPIPVDSVGMFEVLGYSRDGSDNMWTFEVMSIDTGAVYLAPIPFRYTVPGDTSARTAYANSIMFAVSGVDVAEDADIRDIKPPMAAPWGWGDVWPYLLVIGLVVAGWYVYHRYFRNEPGGEDEIVYVPPPKPAHIRALQELHDLEEKKLWQHGRIKEYYSECTEIVRRFYEGRLDFPALEMTSFEILEELRKRGGLTPEEGVVADFLDRADMVKFAKRQPAMEEHEGEMKTAYAIIRSMAESTEEVPTESEVPNAG
jgi:hypothetical protein